MIYSMFWLIAIVLVLILAAAAYVWSMLGTARFLFLFKDHWRKMLIVVAILAVAIVVGQFYKACKTKPSIDIKTVEKLNKANETERLKELETTIVENADVIKTVDGRNSIAELSEDEKQAAIWAKVREADAKIAKAKTQGRDVTGPELECLLVPENCG